MLVYKNLQKAIGNLGDNEDKTVNVSFSVNGTSQLLINESVLYSPILSCKFPHAHELKRWVTAEILPQINNTGHYISYTLPRKGRGIDPDSILSWNYLRETLSVQSKLFQEKSKPLQECKSTFILWKVKKRRVNNKVLLNQSNPCSGKEIRK